jgi:hypothetical protein
VQRFDELAEFCQQVSGNFILRWTDRGKSAGDRAPPFGGRVDGARPTRINRKVDIKFREPPSVNRSCRTQVDAAETGLVFRKLC